MPEFSNIQDWIGAINADLEVKSGKIGNSFRVGIREELESLGRSKGDASVSITQTSSGSLATLNVGEWVEETDRKLIEQQFKTLMERLGATTTGTCSGLIPGPLLTLLKRS